MTAVSIVTPAYNSARFISQTISSVISQSGDFDLHYHVQDGGSSDNTCAIVQSFIDRLADGQGIYCRSITMTLASTPDNGMYDAINRGFANLPIDDSALMTWINTDDLLSSGAINAALAVSSRYQDVSWLGGRIAQVDEHGTVLVVHPPYVYPTTLIARGRCDGRGGRFIQQEGVFWTPDLWKRAGGLDAEIKVAGDWNLWRKFAQFAAFNTVDTITGFHRRHTGQISTDLNKYHSEVDSVAFRPIDASRLQQPKLYRYNYSEHNWNVASPVTKVEDVVFRSATAGTIFASPGVKLLGDTYHVHGAAADTYLTLSDSKPVAAGASVEALASLQVDNEAILSVSLNRDGTTPFEGSQPVQIIVRPGKNVIRVAHAFKHDHSGYRVQIASPAKPALISDVRFVERRPTDLRSLRHAYKGQRCFVVGNGPSLNKMDLNLLDKENVFACNAAFLLFDRIKWRPKFYTCVDSRVTRDRASDIVAMLDANPDMIAFFPRELRLHDGSGTVIDTYSVIPPAPNRYYFNEEANAFRSPPDSAFSLDANLRVAQPYTVAITMLQLATYLGFDPIYLIGCDTSYSIPSSAQQEGRKIGQDGLLLTSTKDDDPNHFDPSYFGKGREWHHPQVDKMLEHHHYSRQVLDKAGIQVFNATVGGQLEVYPRVEYTTLF
ncbi:6-hydroxymethylpterin diphosphokinase MptE-like protein [Mesorhizobium sp. YR577]|uniref:6-hydroxymethylpterin diphosphokinase MptE-like protein n=1 Tax=Mesorhizobium sp. YR577 TaxID=1884373 RepID=UPI000B822E6E|nr:6-hydroxymethylpterin diphosphokinase MptE-like protein [Mesorhizobium sp. YR577]